MSKVSSEMLNQTLRMISLARQSAVDQGKTNQAEQIAPVENKLRRIVTDQAGSGPPSVGSSTLRGSDFQRMLDIKQQQNTASPASFDQDRNGVIQSMASGGMDPVEIARQMGMTREEVDMVIRLGRR
jgi:hypothetical protein